MKPSKSPKAPLSLIVNHDYLSLVHVNWRFTIAFGGDKASGLLARDEAGFKALSGHITSERKAGKKNGDIMQALTREEVISVLWPAWNTVVVTPELKGGDFVRVKADSPQIAKRYPGIYEVKSVTKKYAFIEIAPGSSMGLPRLDLEKVEKPGA